MKELIISILITVFLFFGLILMTVFLLDQCTAELEQKGLKNIIMPLWEGKEGGKK